MDATTFKILGGAVAIVGLIAFGIAWEASLWRECLGDHSFWYCARVLGH